MFSTNYSELTELLPEGTYEMIITGASEEMDQQGRQRLSIVLTVRNDVQQQAQNRILYHSIYKSKEPKPMDAQTANYSFASVMRIAQSAKLPENKNYNNLAELMADFVNRPVKVDVYHDEYNNKKSARVKYWNASETPVVQHKFKSAPTQAQQAQQAQQPTAAPAASGKMPWEN